MGKRAKREALKHEYFNHASHNAHATNHQFYSIGPEVNSLINIAFTIAYFVTSGSLIHSSKLYNGFILVAFDFC